MELAFWLHSAFLLLQNRGLGFYAEHVTILWDDCLRAVKNPSHPGEDIGNTVRYVIVPHFKQQKGAKVCAAGLKVSAHAMK